MITLADKLNARAAEARAHLDRLLEQVTECYATAFTPEEANLAVRLLVREHVDPLPDTVRRAALHYVSGFEDGFFLARGWSMSRRQFTTWEPATREPELPRGGST